MTELLSQETQSIVIWQSLIAGVVTIVLALIQLWTQVIIRKAAASAAAEAEEVKEVLARSTEQTSTQLNDLTKVASDSQKTGVAVYHLANSAFGAALNATAVAKRQLAIQTRDPIDEQSAAQAEEDYKAHVAKQKLIDSGRSSDTPETQQ